MNPLLHAQRSNTTPVWSRVLTPIEDNCEEHHIQAGTTFAVQRGSQGHLQCN